MSDLMVFMMFILGCLTAIVVVLTVAFISFSKNYEEKTKRTDNLLNSIQTDIEFLNGKEYEYACWIRKLESERSKENESVE